jgi:hypothetical protein
MRAAILAVALTTMPGLTAQAEWLASSGAYGGPTQTRAVCYFSNVGQDTSLVLENGPGIYDADGKPQILAIDQCRLIFNRVISPKRHCGIAADIANDASYSCRTKVDDKTEARGTLEFRDSGENVLRTIQLR